MNREQFKKLHRVLRKLLKASGPKAIKCNADVFADCNGTLEGLVELQKVVDAAYGRGVGQMLWNACSPSKPTKTYVWTSFSRWLACVRRLKR